MATVYYEYTTVNNYATCNLYNPADLYSMGRQVQAAEAGNNTTEISFYLKATSSTDYDLRCVVYTSAGVVRATSNTINASTLSTTGDFVTFNGFSLTLNAGDYTMCEVFNSTNTNSVYVGMNTSVSGYGTESQGGYTNFSTWATTLTVKYAGAGIAGSGTLLPPPPAMVRL